MAARISHRQSFWRPSSSAFCNCRSCSRSIALPRGIRQPAAELLERLDVRRRRLALRRVEVHDERSRAVGPVDRVDPRLVRLVE